MKEEWEEEKGQKKRKENKTGEKCKEKEGKSGRGMSI